VLIFGTFLLGLYVPYRLFFVGTPAKAVRPYEEKFTELLYWLCRAVVYWAILANLVTIFIGLRYYNGSVYSAKESIKEGGGVFILAQLHLFFMVPYIYLARKRGTPWRNTIFMLGCLLFARSVLMGERLAFLEFALPLVVVLSMLMIIRVTWTRLLLLAV